MVMHHVWSFINIWQDLPEGAVLDVGILFQEARQLTALHFYIPGPVEINNVIDLSKDFTFE
jgi:hypothetical protein